MYRLAPALVAVLVILGGGAFAMQALRSSGGQRGLSLSIEPARQAAAPGHRVRFSVSVRPTGRPVTLRAQRLPGGVRATFRLDGGRRAGVVPAGRDGATLTLAVSRRARVGRHRVVLAARSGRQARKRSLWLTVVARPNRLRRLAVGPAQRTVIAGGSVAYRVKWNGRVRRSFGLGVRSLPPRVRAAWSPSATVRRRRPHRRLIVRTDRDAESSSSRLLVSMHGGRWTRTAVVVLDVRRGEDFDIAGDLAPPLHPGRSEPLELRLTNPNDFTIEATRLAVAIRSATSNPGCGAENYAVAQYRGPYPLRLPPGRTRLSELVGDRSLWPQLSMLNLPTNQDACKNARLSVDYSGQARR